MKLMNRRTFALALSLGAASLLIPSFAMAEPGAQVDPKARVHDSVILDGGIVESGAVVVRSLVCAGGVVRKDHKTVDQIIAPASARANSREKAA